MRAFFEHPIAYAVPDRLTADSAWTSHVPFGMVLTALLKPRSVVELGTQGGDSYCAFCQAIAAHDIDARAVAIDTWEGDPQAGFYGPDVLADLRAHHDRRYGSFSRLLPARFEDARAEVPDGSVDLLHIDGEHGYDAVRRDWETWRSALSDRGVVLFHDTEERGEGFGVHRLFAELAETYPTFAFFHGHGLGVVGFGDALDGPVRNLLACSATDARRVRLLFQRLGELTVVRRDQDLHRAAVEEARLERDDARRAAAVSDTRREAAEAAREAEHAAHAATRVERDEALEAVTEARTQLEARSAEVARTAAALAQRESSRATLEREFESAREAADHLEARVAELERELAAERADGERARTQHQAEQDAVRAERDDAREQARQLGEAVAQWQAAAEAATAEQRAAHQREQDATASAEHERDAAKVERDDIQKRLEALVAEHGALRAQRVEWSEAVRRARGLEQELTLLREDRVRMEHSVGFRAVAWQRRVMDRLLPHGTRRRVPYVQATTTVGRWLQRPAATNPSIAHEPVRAPAPAPPASRPAPVRAVAPRPRPPLIELTFAPIEVPVSVIIPTLNGEAEGIARGLRGFRQQEGLTHPLELVVIDSASTDRTTSIAQAAGATVHTIDRATFNHGATRNRAAELANGELILFSVQDAVPGHPTLLQEMADLLLGEDLAVVSAKQLTRADADPYCAFSLFHHYRMLGDDTRVTPAGSQAALAAARGEARWRLGFVDDVCALHQRRIFDALQYRPMSYGEDLEYGLRCVEEGHGLGFYADAGVVHSHLRSAAFQLRTHYIVRRDLGSLLDGDLPRPGSGLGGLIAAGRLAYACLDAVPSGANSPGPAVRAVAAHLRTATGPARMRPPSGEDELDALLARLAPVATGAPDMTLLDTMAGTLEKLALPFLERTYPQLEAEDIRDFVRKNLSATLGAALGNAATHAPPDEAARLAEVLA